MENRISKASEKADKEVMYICEHHLDSREDWTPLVYNKKLDKSVCIKCGAQYGIFMGVQVLWTKELEAKAIMYAQEIAGPGGTVVKEKTIDANFVHPTPLTEEPERPEPPKEFYQLLHDFIRDWKNTHPLDDGMQHANASKILFEMYASLSQRGWTDLQIKQYFNIPLTKNLI